MTRINLGLLSTLLIIQTPILFAALSANVASRSGYFNVGIEGLMTISAFFAVVFSHFFQNAILAFILTMVLGLVQGLILYFVDNKLKVNSILSGIAYNLIAMGLTSILLNLLGDRGISTSLQTIPFARHSVSIMGKEIYYNISSILGILSIFIIYIFNEKTVLGIRIFSVGKSVEFSKISGLDINKYRLISLLISSVLASMAGASLTLGYLPWFSRDMVAGRGFIGLAIDVMSSGSALLSGFFAVVLSFMFTLSNHQSLFNLKPELLELIPYVSVFIIIILRIQLVRIKRKKYDKNKDII